MPEQYLGWWQIRQPAGPATAAPKTKPLLPRPPPRRSGKRGARSARGASQRGPQASDWVQVESKDGARSKQSHNINTPGTNIKHCDTI